jgi:hypothetical protein
VIAIDEGEVELGSLGGEARQDDLRADGMMLNQAAYPCVLEDLKAAIRESRVLERVDDDVLRLRRVVVKQAIADIERRERRPECDFQRLPSTLADDPPPQCLPFSNAYGDRKDLVHRPVRTCDNGALQHKPIDRRSHRRSRLHRCQRTSKARERGVRSVRECPLSATTALTS